MLHILAAFMEKCKVGSLTIVIRFNKTDYSEIHETIFAYKNQTQHFRCNKSTFKIICLERDRRHRYKNSRTVDTLANIYDVHVGISCQNLHQELILSHGILTYNSIGWWLSAWILCVSVLFKSTFPYLICDGLLYLSTGIYHLSRVISLHESEVHCHRRA